MMVKGEGDGVTTLGRRIAALRNEAGLKQEDVAKELGVSPSTVSVWECDKGGINHDMLRRLAETLSTHLRRSVTVDFLLGGAADYPDPSTDFPLGLTVKVPVFGTVPAGEPTLAEQNIEGWEEVPVQETQNGQFFFLRVKGDSMEGGGIHDGDLVFVRSQTTVEDGEIAVVLLNGEDATLKRVTRQNGQIVLEAQNPKYRALLVSPSSVRVLGKAMWSRHNLV
jgi:repressor LexA